MKMRAQEPWTRKSNLHTAVRKEADPALPFALFQAALGTGVGTAGRGRMLS